jgi:hypothetical protein
MNLIKKFLLSAAAATLFGTSATQAGDPLLGGVAPSQPASTIVAPSSELTEDSLLLMLRNLGYDPKITTYSNGQKGFPVVVEHNNFTVHVVANFSPSKKVVYLKAYLGQIPAVKNIPAEVLAKLLEVQVNSKGRFFISGDNLYYQMPLDNTGITPQALRFWLDELVAQVKENLPYWNTTKWTTEGQVANALNDKVNAAEAKFTDALTALSKVFAAAMKGDDAAAANLDSARIQLLKVVQGLIVEAETMVVPNNPESQALAKAWVNFLKVKEQLLQNEIAEMVQILADTKVPLNDRITKVQSAAAPMTAKETPAGELLTKARKDYKAKFNIG